MSSEIISLDDIHFDELGHAVISDPRTVERLRRAVRKRKSIHIEPRANSRRNGTSVAVKTEIELCSSSSPTLIRGIAANSIDSDRAIANMLFPSRSVQSLGPIIDEETPALIRRKIVTSDFEGQTNFAAKPFDIAYEESNPVTRYVLKRLAEKYDDLVDGATKSDLKVTVSVHRKNSYRQLQNAHIDWIRGTEYCEAEWQRQQSIRTNKTDLKSLETLHSLDCVLGGPPTEFFLDEQLAAIHLQRASDGRWTVDYIELLNNDHMPIPGLLYEILFRPGFTIHQFPPAEKWATPNEMRLFVSCDFHGADSITSQPKKPT